MRSIGLYTMVAGAGGPFRAAHLCVPCHGCIFLLYLSNSVDMLPDAAHDYYRSRHH